MELCEECFEGVEEPEEEEEEEVDEEDEDDDAEEDDECSLGAISKPRGTGDRSEPMATFRKPFQPAGGSQRIERKYRHSSQAGPSTMGTREAAPAVMPVGAAHVPWLAACFDAREPEGCVPGKRTLFTR